MTRKASSLPPRNRRTSCSSERRRNRGPAETRARWGASTAVAGMVDASTRSLLTRSTGDRRQSCSAVFDRIAGRGWGEGRPLRGDARHHVLDLRVVLEAVLREVLAVAGLLEAAVRHLGDE